MAVVRSDPAMPLRLNTLLHPFGIEPGDVRLLRHQDTRAAKGRSPYELWRDQRVAFEDYQSLQSEDNRSRLKASFWASFVVSDEGSTLLAGFYKVEYRGLLATDTPRSYADGIDLAGSCDLWRLTEDERFSDLSGRLVIDWGLGERAWVQRADNQDKLVLEVRQAFREPDFPGPLNVVTRLSRIGAMPASWRSALSSVSGIYLLTCPKTREQYVGAAYGENGFYGRWLDYARSGHGGNVGLKSRDPSDYQVSILEIAGSAATVSDIVALEARWKQKLQSLEMGLNRN